MLSQEGGCEHAKLKRVQTGWLKFRELSGLLIGKGMSDAHLGGIKLLEHGMKVAERVLERRLRQAVKIDKMQFGFTPGTGTTHAIFIARQLQEKI